MASLISIVMSNLNKGGYIRDAIESVLNQSHRDIELIIVDNGSTDNSLTIAEEYSLNDGRVQLYHESKKGHTIAMNIGIGHAKGEFITMMDSDDVIHEEKLSKQLQGLSVTNANISYTDGWEMNASGESIGHVFHRDIIHSHGAGSDGTVFRELVGQRGFNELLGATLMFRRECGRKEIFDSALRYYDDWDLWVRLSRHFMFDYVPEPLYGYRIYGGNNWTSLSEKAIQEIQVAVYVKWLSIFDDLDREDKNLIVENLWRRYASLHDNGAMLRLALRYRTASGMFARKVGKSLNYRVQHSLSLGRYHG